MINKISQWKKNKSIVMITAYDYYSAKIASQSPVDSILVGDSLGMVIKGEKNTQNVSMDEVIYHLKSVRRGAGEDLFIIADLPFLSYGVEHSETVRNAGRLIQNGADAVKLEGAHPETVKKLVSTGIPVMGHLGMTPQKYKIWGSMAARGRTDTEKQRIKDDAAALCDAGIFSLVLEYVPDSLAQAITSDLTIPVIGIGAGPHTDGQILVWHDILGFDREFTPPFVKKYTDLNKIITQALTEYSDDVKNKSFPGPEHTPGDIKK